MILTKVLVLIEFLIIPALMAAGMPSSVTIKPASHVTIDTGALADTIKLPQDFPWHVSVTVYRYTTGTEIFSIGSDETVRESSRGGEARALVMLFKDKVLVASGFVIARGENHEYLMVKLGAKISEYLAASPKR